MLKGIIGINLWNLLIVGAIAVLAVWAYNGYLAGMSVGGVTLARA